MALPNAPTSDLEAELGLSNKPGVADLAILPRLGGSEGRGTAGLATSPVPRRAAVGGYGAGDKCGHTHNWFFLAFAPSLSQVVDGWRAFTSPCSGDLSPRSPLRPGN